MGNRWLPIWEGKNHRSVDLIANHGLGASNANAFSDDLDPPEGGAGPSAPGC